MKCFLLYFVCFLSLQHNSSSLGFLGSPRFQHCYSASEQSWRFPSQSRAVAIKASTSDEELIEEDDNERPVLPYGNKSIAWTNRFRSLFPYETARRSVMDLGLRSKEEWDDYVADGKPQHGPYLPNRPHEMYAEEWESWDEFLGLIRPYDETRRIVRDILQLKSMEEYEEFVELHRKRAEGLRIPAMPRKVYKDSGWVSDEHFFS